MKKKGICAGIVLYNPDIEGIIENINLVLEQVEFLIIVDNNSENINEVLKSVRDLELKNIKVILNKKNEGIAKALNQIVLVANEMKYEWILTLDQDSKIKNGLIKAYIPYLKDDIGQITCLIEDINIGIMHAKDFSGEVRNIERCITSGCLMNVKACIDVGMFDEKMFIDYVDFDMSFALREHGYQIIQVNFNGLIHEMGTSIMIKIGNKELIVTKHESLIRYFYYARNLTYCIRKHYKKGVLDKKKYILKLIGRLGAIFFYEDKPMRKVSKYCKGIFYGIKMKVDNNNG